MTGGLCLAAGVHPGAHLLSQPPYLDLGALEDPRGCAGPPKIVAVLG